MESEQFSLCWNNFHNNLRTGFHSLLLEEDLVDVTLAADGRYLKAHKTVLSVCSPYFKELFRANPCDHPIVILQDVKYSALKNLLQFMYQGEVSVGQDEIPTFMKVAEMLKIKGLTENNANNSNIPSDTNGVDDDNRDSPYMYENLESKHLVKRTRAAKRLLRPIQHLRPLESPKTVKSPSSARSPQSVPSPQPPSKKPCLDEDSERIPNHPVNPKQEPEDHEDEFNEDSSVDMSSMLDTTMGESHASGSWTPDLKVPADTSSPDHKDLKMEIFVAEDVLEEAQEVAGNLLPALEEAQEVAGNLEAQELADNLLPAKSREKYEKQFAHFVTWRKARGVHGTNQDILLDYFRSLSENCVGSSLWCKYSMLKSTLKIEEKEDISRFPKLLEFLKKKSSIHRAKKANILEKAHIDKFLEEADNNEYLMMKIVLIMGIFGACRCEELAKMTVDDVTEVGTYLSVNLPATKTDKPRQFVIVKEGCSVDPVALYRKYISLRPAKIKNHRLFLRYVNGKCTDHPVGIHKIGSIPSVVASYLKLEHPETYTGHSLRRSSTMLQVATTVK